MSLEMFVSSACACMVKWTSTDLKKKKNPSTPSCKCFYWILATAFLSYMWILEGPAVLALVKRKNFPRHSWHVCSAPGIAQPWLVIILYKPFSGKTCQCCEKPMARSALQTCIVLTMSLGCVKNPHP